MEKENPFRRMSERWPSSVVARSEVPKFTGGLITIKYIQNLDSCGLGVPGRFRVGRLVCYPIENLISWLESRSTSIPERGAEGHVPGKTPGQRRIE